MKLKICIFCHNHKPLVVFLEILTKIPEPSFHGFPIQIYRKQHEPYHQYVFFKVITRNNEFNKYFLLMAIARFCKHFKSK